MIELFWDAYYLIVWLSPSSSISFPITIPDRPASHLSDYQKSSVWFRSTWLSPSFLMKLKQNITIYWSTFIDIIQPVFIIDSHSHTYSSFPENGKLICQINILYAFPLLSKDQPVSTDKYKLGTAHQHPACFISFSCFFYVFTNIVYCNI
jgi:hypothetical protein